MDRIQPGRSKAAIYVRVSTTAFVVRSATNHGAGNKTVTPVVTSTDCPFDVEACLNARVPMAQPWMDDVLISSGLSAVFSLLVFALILRLRRRDARPSTRNYFGVGPGRKRTEDTITKP